jgi:hypothetical protein
MWSRKAAVIGSLPLLLLLDGAFFAKGVVRVSTPQMSLAMVTALLVLAAMADTMTRFRLGRRLVPAMAALTAIFVIWSLVPCHSDFDSLAATSG